MNQMMQSVLQISVLSAATIVVVLLIRLAAGRRMKTPLLSVLWIIVLIRLILPVMIPAPFYVGDAFLNRSQTTSEVTEPMQANPNGPQNAVLGAEDGVVENGHMAEATGTANPMETAIETTGIREKLMDVFLETALVFWIWMCGSVTFLTISLWRMAMFRRKVLRGQPVSDTALLYTLLRNKRRLNIRRTVVAVESDCVDVPVVMGLFKPIIILPHGLIHSLNRDKMDMVILHEMCHIKRGDLYKNALWLFAKAIHWFNPLVWTAYGVYLSDTERACDDMIAKGLSTREIVLYSEALVAVIKRSKIRQSIPVHSSFCKDNTKLRKRVENMLRPKKKSGLVTLFTVVTIMILLVGCFTTACLKSEQTEQEEPISAEAVEADGAIEPEEMVYDGDAQITEEQAIEIAAKYAKADAELIYQKYLLEEDVRIYEIKDKKNETYFNIYSIGGALKSVFVDSDEPSDDDTVVSEQEMLQKVENRAKELWGEGQTLDVEIETIGSEMFSFVLHGTMTDEETGFAKRFNAFVYQNGTVYYIEAAYPAGFFSSAEGASDEALQKALSYALTDSEEVEYTPSRQDYILTFMVDNGKTQINLLKSDLSLYSLSTKLYDVGLPINYTETEARNRIRAYIEAYFPYSEDDFSWSGALEEDVVCYAEALIETKEGEIEVYTEMNGNGDLIAIGKKTVPEEAMVTLSDDQAREAALEYVVRDYMFVDRDEVEFVESYQSEDENVADTTIYVFRYTSKEQTSRDFSFTSYVGIKNETGEFATMWSEPVVDGIHMISEDEAIDLARGYISEHEGVASDELVFDSIEVQNWMIIEYSVTFTHGSKVYTATLLVDTGQLDAIQTSTE